MDQLTFLPDEIMVRPLLLLPIGLVAFGLYLTTYGLAGIVWPSPLPGLSEAEKIRRELELERRQQLYLLRAHRPVYRLPWLERHLRPLSEELGRGLAGFISKIGFGSAARNELVRKLAIAGQGETLASFYGQRVTSGVIVSAIAGFLQLEGVVELSLLLVLSIAAAGYYLPLFSLNRKVRQRREEVVGQLPNLIDLLSINVSAGLGLEQALRRVVEKGTGTLPFSIRRAFEEIQYRNVISTKRHNNLPQAELLLVGLGEEVPSRPIVNTGNLVGDALRMLAERYKLPELDDFVLALEASQRKGIAITETLANQAVGMREKRRTRLVVAGQKAVVKMLLPIVLFILPAFMLLLLTPAVIQFLALTA